MSTLLLTRIALACAAAVLAASALAYRRRTLALLREFFAAESHPLNLAVMRVTMFLTLLQSANRRGALEWFAGLPAVLRVAPLGWGHVLKVMPVDPSWAAASYWLFSLFCLAGLVGLFSRASAFLAFLVGIYALGVPQFYGKINHYHHLLWFMALLAASPCGDALSLDAVRAARRRADAGTTEPPGPSRAYALPLRFVWLLMGVLYFFPGFWKTWTVGARWALSENLKFHLYMKWVTLDGWVPFFRIDRHPVLYQASGLGTILFELSFVFLVLFPFWRGWAALGGLVFHNMTALFMRIPFWSLQVFYVTFVDWHRLFRRLGRFMFRREKSLAYDGDCKLCRRAVATRRAFDLFGRTAYVNSPGASALHARHGEGAIDNRHGAAPPLRRSARSALYVGVSLVILNFVCGVVRLDTWPLSIYPTFAERLYRPETQTITISATKGGAVKEVRPLRERKGQAPERLDGLLRHVLLIGDEGERRRALEALWQVWAKDDPELRDAESVRFYRDTITTIPEGRDDPPLRRELIAEMKF
jgi:hypothetical protein